MPLISTTEADCSRLLRLASALTLACMVRPEVGSWGCSEHDERRVCVMLRGASLEAIVNVNVHGRDQCLRHKLPLQVCAWRLLLLTKLASSVVGRAAGSCLDAESTGVYPGVRGHSPMLVADDEPAVPLTLCACSPCEFTLAPVSAPCASGQVGGHVGC